MSFSSTSSFILFVRMFLFSFLFVEAVSAQSRITEREIKLSGNYKYGEGFSMDLEVSRTNARQQLLQGIQVLISTETELIEEERGAGVISDYRSNVRIQSRMQLEGLRFHEDQRRDGSWWVIAYISNEDFERTIENIRRRMFLKLENAVYFERTGNYNRAIALYYEIFAEAPGLPIQLFSDADEHGAALELQQFAREKILEWLNGIDIELVRVRDRSVTNSVELYIDLNLRYKGQPVEYLNVRLNRPGYGLQAVLNGNVELFYDLNPESLLEDITIRLELNPPPLVMIPEDSRSIAERNRPVRNRTIRVDFSDLINPDFVIEELADNHFQFIPRPGILSVTSVEWNFGDGNRSTELQPRHTFLNMRQARHVTLRFNQSPELEVTKTIEPSGNLIRVVNPKLTRPIELEAGYYVPFHQREYIQRISGMKSYRALQSYLLRLVDSNVLASWGAQRNVRPEHSYIILTDPDTEHVHVILSPVRSFLRFDVLRDDVMSYDSNEWVESFRGYRPVYIQFQ